MTTRLRHLALRCRDMERPRSFYEAAFIVTVHTPASSEGAGCSAKCA